MLPLTVPAESLKPPPNLPPGSSLMSRVLFGLRPLLDLQVASVLPTVKAWLSSRQGRLLEIGCGGQPYRHLVAENCDYTGLDSSISQEGFGYSAPDTVYYDGDVFPFPDDAFDSVFHTEVIEHVFLSSVFLAECKRVLKDKGQLLFTVPFQARYHYIPHDYWRFTPAALERLLTEAGFRDIRIAHRGTDITVAAYKFVTLTYRWASGPWSAKLLSLLFSPLFGFSLIMGQLSLRYMWGSRDDTLGYIVTASA